MVFIIINIDGITYPNGDKYYGDIKDNKRHGKGTASNILLRNYVVC